MARTEVSIIEKDGVLTLHEEMDTLSALASALPPPARNGFLRTVANKLADYPAEVRCPITVRYSGDGPLGKQRHTKQAHQNEGDGHEYKHGRFVQHSLHPFHKPPPRL
jgi:hypothetical protein